MAQRWLQVRCWSRRGWFRSLFSPGVSGRKRQPGVAGWRFPPSLRVGGNHRHLPGLALGNHFRCGDLVLLEMIGFAMRLQRRFVIVDLIEEDVVRVTVEVDDVEPLAA